MKHTPGPWMEDGDMIQAEDSTVAREVLNEANARLIAAAPEMFKFLQLFAAGNWSSGEAAEARELLNRIEGD